MMSGCCGHDAKFDGVSGDYKRRLWIVIALNATMFVVEMTAGHMAKSQALQADALDFFGDALTYGISLAVIGASVRVRTSAAKYGPERCPTWRSPLGVGGSAVTM